MRYLSATLALAASVAMADGERFDAALEAAAIRQTSLASLTENSLILGNGDLNALLYADGTGIKLRLTKNDVWDARVDTSGDPALAVINVSNHTVTGGTGSPSSWSKTYPCPLTCAVLGLSSSAAASPWQNIRAQGSINTWAYTNGVATMAIQGAAGASCGWQCPLTALQPYSNVHLRVSGTANARHFIDVKNFAGSYVPGSGWQTTPTNEQEYVFNLPAGTVPGTIILYLWTTNGALAENRYTLVEFQGASGNLALDLSRVSPLPAASTLDLRRAKALVPGLAASNTVTVRALADRNAFIVEGDTAAALQPSTATFIPAAVRGTNAGIVYLHQSLPADPGYPTNGDWAGMSFAVALATQAQRAAVSLVTSLESSNVIDDAVALAGATLAADPSALIAAHEAAWSNFWAACRVDLADTFLRGVWYRNLYFMRCISKAGVKPVGLFAGLVSDSAAWHGDFHLNYNAQQTYWGWYGLNHAELAEPYEWLIRRHLPRAQWLGATTYGFSGACYAHTVFLHEPPDAAACVSRNGRQVAFIPYTYTIGDSGWAVQNLWLHYRHHPDAGLLASNVYPAIREVAEFYANFAERCATNPATGRVVLGPTYSPEHWSLGKDDGTCDIAFARLALRAALESATLLELDAPLTNRWRATLDKLPDYPRTTGASPVILDVAGVSTTTYNVPVPALPVYPAGDITWFSPAAEKEVFTNTIARMSSNGNNDTMILGGARARLSMPDAYAWTRARFLERQRSNGTLSIAAAGAGFNAYGHYTEDFAASAVVAELLFQSVGGILRFFPAWPVAQDAAFEKLRAEGGFLVSTELTGGAIPLVRVQSTAGGRLRFLSPWPAAAAWRRGAPAALADEGAGILALETAPGDDLLLTPTNFPAFAAWQLQIFGSTNRADAAAEADPDADGLDNAAEFRAGTQPTNRASVLQSVRIATGSNGFQVVTWDSIGARTYRVQAAPGADAPFEEITGDIVDTNTAGAPGTLSYVDDRAAAPGSNLIYRVRLP